MTDTTTLLLVEDDLGLRTFLADNLTADGFNVLLADSVRDAVRLLEYKQPDLALVDLGLPDGSGLDLIRRVREADGVASRLDPGLPLVILTGRVSELDRVRGFDRGADDFVCKPFSYAELRGTLVRFPWFLSLLRVSAISGARRTVSEVFLEPRFGGNARVRRVRAGTLAPT